MRAWTGSLGAAALLLASQISVAAGDPVNGEKLHQDCLGCHGTELYVAPKAKVRSLAALRREVDKWNDRMNPKFTRQEIEDLIAWLNRDFYKFPQ
jgi:mono/diheme cytochrome c family protein